VSDRGAGPRPRPRVFPQCPSRPALPARLRGPGAVREHLGGAGGWEEEEEEEEEEGCLPGKRDRPAGLAAVVRAAARVRAGRRGRQPKAAGRGEGPRVGRGSVGAAAPEALMLTVVAGSSGRPLFLLCFNGGHGGVRR